MTLVSQLWYTFVKVRFYPHIYQFRQDNFSVPIKLVISAKIIQNLKKPHQNATNKDAPLDLYDRQDYWRRLTILYTP